MKSYDRVMIEAYVYRDMGVQTKLKRPQTALHYAQYIDQLSFGTRLPMGA